MPYYSFARDWLPDVEALNNPGLIEAAGVWPDVKGLRPIPGLVTADSVSAATITQVVGVYGTLLGGNQAGAAIFAGSSDRLWYIDGSGSPTWVNKSNTSASYANTMWSFARVRDIMIATGSPNVPQRSSITSSATTFVDLAGTPPTAFFVAVVKDFVVMARTTASPTLVQWSALGDPNDYVASATTQADSQILSEDGPIVGIVGGEYGIIFFQNAIYRMTYIGSPAIFQFDKIAIGIGICAGVASAALPSRGYHACRYNDDVYFISDRGLSVIRSGQIVQSLGANRNERYLRSALSVTDVQFGEQPKFIAADYLYGMIAMGFARGGAQTASYASTMIFYNPLLDRFSRASIAASFLFSAPQLAINQGSGGTWMLGVFNSSNRLQVMDPVNAANMAATIESGEIQPAGVSRAIINWVRPEIQASSVSVAVKIGYRNKTNESVSYGALVPINATGVSPQRINARNMRVNIQIPTFSWSAIHGFYWEPIPGGDR